MPFSWQRAGLLVVLITASLGLMGSSGAEERPVLKLSAKRFEYTPRELTLKRGVPVTIELTAEDRQHGFKVPELGLRLDALPGETTRVDLVPGKAGRFDFLCDVFCGSGHEDMDGQIVVED